MFINNGLLQRRGLSFIYDGRMLNRKPHVNWNNNVSPYKNRHMHPKLRGEPAFTKKTFQKKDAYVRERDNVIITHVCNMYAS